MSAEGPDAEAVPMICRVCGRKFVVDAEAAPWGTAVYFHQGRMVGTCNLAMGALPKHPAFLVAATYDSPARWPFKPDGVMPEKESL